MENTIVLTMREQKRVEVIQKVFRGEMTMAEAAMVLGVCQRHSYRIKARIREEGVKRIIHGNRGRICHWKLSAKTYGRTAQLLDLSPWGYRLLSGQTQIVKGQ